MSTSNKKFVWKLKSKPCLIERPLLVGVINLTPDSFYDGGRYQSVDAACLRAEALVREGADLIDIGAESSKPGAHILPIEEELGRLIPVLKVLTREFSVPFSVDTTKRQVAEEALNAGAEVINDVSGLQHDPALARSIAHSGCGLILMHRRGNAATMQSMTDYQDVVSDVMHELEQQMEFGLAEGIDAQQIVVDPGIGFSKNKEQNLEILRRLKSFHVFDRPVMVGVSRKSFIGAITGRAAEDRLFGTVAACVLALQNGAHIFRVHDVGSVREALDVAQSIIKKESEVSL